MGSAMQFAAFTIVVASGVLSAACWGVLAQQQGIARSHFPMSLYSVVNGDRPSTDPSPTNFHGNFTPQLTHPPIATKGAGTR